MIVEGLQPAKQSNTVDIVAVNTFFCTVTVVPRHLLTVIQCTFNSRQLIWSRQNTTASTLHTSDHVARVWAPKT